VTNSALRVTEAQTDTTVATDNAPTSTRHRGACRLTARGDGSSCSGMDASSQSVAAAFHGRSTRLRDRRMSSRLNALRWSVG
jgi:hypothetical protein